MHQDFNNIVDTATRPLH